MVLGKDGQKLSKRHGSTSVQEFRKQGYLPEAIVNYVALLGWAYDDSREIFSLSELEELFDVEKLNKASAIFDYKKLQWLNGMHIRKKTDDELQAGVLPHLQQEDLLGNPLLPAEQESLGKIIPLLRERMRLLTDAPQLVRFLFQEVEIVGPEVLVPKRLTAEKARIVLEEQRELMREFFSDSDDENEERFRSCASRLEVKFGDFMMPLRVAVTGSTVSLPLFESIRLLGPEKTRERIQKAIDVLKVPKTVKE